MAAAAYDVAALALKGPDTHFNFPDCVYAHSTPASNSPADVRAAATTAARSMRRGRDEGGSASTEASAAAAGPGCVGGEDGVEENYDEFVDEEALFDMPKLLASMAEGMLVSPPRMDAPDSDGSPENSDGGDSLWSYR